MSEQQNTEGPEVRPFAAILQELARGSVHNEASEKLHALVDAVTEHGSKGTLTLTLTVAPIAKGDVSVLTVGAAVASKPPVAAQTSAFFVDRGGNLSRRDPKQPDITGLSLADNNPERRAQ